MSSPSPPPEVHMEFLRQLQDLLARWKELLIPVLRGGLLLRHWFGEAARASADIDLECFEQPRPPLNPEELEDLDEEERAERERRHGMYGEFESLVDFGKAMCRYAVNNTQRYRWVKQLPRPLVEFQETEVPEDGSSLWVYGTPGERYYAGWTHHGNPETSGLLQIDIAQPATYKLDDISVTELELIAPEGGPFRFLGYTPEMLLAAKVSWLVRSLKRRFRENVVLAPEWSGEPKDLFDIHLLLTRADLQADVFQKCLLAIGTEDKLEWNHLEALFDVQRTTMRDEDFANWEPFRVQHANLVKTGPVEMMCVIAQRLEPLLGDFYRRDEMPFLLAINADPVDEFAYLIYADWLDDHGTGRGTFLRLYTRDYFHRDELTMEDRERNAAELREALRETSLPWLYQLFGTTARAQEIRQRLQVT